MYFITRKCRAAAWLEKIYLTTLLTPTKKLCKAFNRLKSREPSIILFQGRTETRELLLKETLLRLMHNILLIRKNGFWFKLTMIEIDLIKMEEELLLKKELMRLDLILPRNNFSTKY